MRLTRSSTATTLDGFIADADNSRQPVLGVHAPLLPRRVEPRLEALGQSGDFVAARYAVV